MIIKADDEVVCETSRPLTVVLHQQDMVIEGVGAYLIGPEQTVKLSNELEQDQWALILQHANFMKAWDTLWEPAKPPAVLAKAPLATRHSVGMILMLYKARAEGLPMHIQYPETYLHPAQCTRLMSMIYYIFPEKRTA